MMLFFCPVCGDRECEVLGTVCSGCRIQSIRQRPEGTKKITEGKCFYCGKETLLDQEHIVPLARGGPHEPWNLTRACFSCNGNKNDQIPSEWCPTHQEAMAVERRVPVIFPRMRLGVLVNEHAQGYARVRALCANFLHSLQTEMKALPSRKKTRILTAYNAISRLQSHLDSVISESEAKAFNSTKEEFRHRSRRGD